MARNETKKSISEILCHITTMVFSFHCLKSIRIRSFSGPYFPAFEFLVRIQSECG